MKHTFYYLILLVISCLPSSCISVDKKNSDSNKTNIFRTSESDLIFLLNIDDNFSYYDSLRNEDIPLGFKIGAYDKHLKKISTIKLRINERDTLFQYPLYKVDSILFGLRPNGSFYVITNQNKDAWLME